jgi:L,D-transpeptidase YbiS
VPETKSIPDSLTRDQTVIIDFTDKSVSIPLIILGALFFLFIVIQISGRLLAGRNQPQWEDYLKTQKFKPREVRQIAYRNKILKNRIENSSARGIYVVIDTAGNILYIKRGNKVLQQAVVSCGSGSILEEPNGNRKWVFDTPRGEFIVQSKLRNPVWVKPDWAFIEEGEKIPQNENERIEAGVLGEYALGFGEGYFIHGTLYSRMLGRNVTHGCIRIGDNDLKMLYRSVPIGARLYIY